MKKLIKKIFIVMFTILLVVPLFPHDVFAVTVGASSMVLHILNGKNMYDLDNEENTVLNVLANKGVIRVDEEGKKVYDEQNKLLFTVDNNGIATLGNDIGEDDSVEYRLTADERVGNLSNVEELIITFSEYCDMEFELSDGASINDFNQISGDVMNAFRMKGLILVDEEKGEVFSPQNKLLFSIDGEGIIHLADNLSEDDNIEYTIPEEERVGSFVNIRTIRVILVRNNNSIILRNKEYTLNSDLATAIFTFEEGYDFELNMNDILSLTPEEILNNYGIDEETFNNYLDMIKNSLKQYGDLIALYDITINDGRFGYSDAVTLKIKLTELMKKYNKLQLIYLDENNNFKVQEIKDLIIGNETADANLDHLSAYALVGSNVETTTNNPVTGDNIFLYVSILGISVLGVVGLGLYLNRKKTMSR